MPEVKEIQKHFKNNPDFAMLTVSLDGQDSGQALLDTIREKHITYPVLHVGAQDGWNDGNFDWGITGVPSAYIIDPQGNIFAEVYPRASLIDTFEWLHDSDQVIPPLGFSSAYETLEDGSTSFTVKVSNPTHEPVEVSVNVLRIARVYDPELDTEGTGEPNTYEYQDLSAEGCDYGFTASFGEFGEALHEFMIPPQENAEGLFVSFSAPVPGMQSCNDGAGFFIGSSEYIQFQKAAE